MAFPSHVTPSPMTPVYWNVPTARNRFRIAYDGGTGRRNRYAFFDGTDTLGTKSNLAVTVRLFIVEVLYEADKMDEIFGTSPQPGSDSLPRVRPVNYNNSESVSPVTLRSPNKTRRPCYLYD